MRRIPIVFCLVAYFFCPAGVSAQVIPTSQWVAVWSDATLFNGDPVAAGAAVQAFDPDGVLCGQFTVAVPGSFGLMPVYRDDPSTPLVDEGADPGDVLSFRIDGTEALTMGPDVALWTANGATLHVDLSAGPVPVQRTTWGSVKGLFGVR